VVVGGTVGATPYSWSPHVAAEIRMVVYRRRGAGVGRALSHRRLPLARGRGLEKLSLQMTSTSRAAIACREPGFKPRRCCADHVRDVDGRRTTLSCSGTCRAGRPIGGLLGVRGRPSTDLIAAAASAF